MSFVESCIIKIRVLNVPIFLISIYAEEILVYTENRETIDTREMIENDRKRQKR